MLRDMRGLVLVSLLASASALAGPDPIIGGSAATQGEYPNVVGVVLQTSGGVALCTGTLITPEWVMTAGHCVLPSEAGVGSQSDVTAAIRVFVGALTIFPTPPGNEGLGAQDTMPDPMFDINALGSHDMGLIHLTSPVEGVTPVRLNFSASAAQPGLAVTQVGYGETSNNGPAGTLETVGQTTVSCSSIGLSGADADLLCFNQTNGTGKCSGDSGGPSFANIGGETTEVGVTSFGDPNCTSFGADTRVDAEKAFLLANVPSLMTCNADSDCDAMHECFNHECIADPYSPGGLGSSCTSGADCESSDCIATSADGMRCSMACSPNDDSTCPGGFECLADGTGGQCAPGSGGGCCDASGHGAPTALLGLALVGIVWRRRRR